MFGFLYDDFQIRNGGGTTTGRVGAYKKDWSVPQLCLKVPEGMVLPGARFKSF